MLFNSIQFLIFGPLAVSLYFFMPSRVRRYWLLAASLYFYAIFEIAFLPVLLFSITLTYICARFIEVSKQKFTRKLFLTVSIIGNGGMLFVFKYLDFFIRIINQTFGYDVCNPSYHQPVGLILPLGISFFSFQAIAYSVDVYRKTIHATRDFIDFALFKSFFPQLVAGPIMRAKDLIHQFTEVKKFSRENFEVGLRIVAIGFFKKSMIADPIGVLVDDIFASPESYNGFSILLSGYLHAIQIYCDFSGYSDIAIGTARIMGFMIPENFNRPFFAKSITEFWRRWHISLSSWLRDYIYISLGGNRTGPIRANLNVLITWFTGGVWHGADWTFVIWGVMQAVVIMMERFGSRLSYLAKTVAYLPSPVKIFYSFSIFSLSMIFFRSHPTGHFTEGISVAFYMFKSIFTFAQGKMVFIPSTIWIPLLMLFMIEALKETGLDFYRKEVESPVVTYILSAVILISVTIIYSVTISQQFIYFQF